MLHATGKPAHGHRHGHGTHTSVWQCGTVGQSQWVDHDRDQAQISIDCIVNPFFPRSLSAWEARPSSLQCSAVSVGGRLPQLALCSPRLTLLRLALSWQGNSLLQHVRATCARQEFPHLFPTGRCVLAPSCLALPLRVFARIRDRRLLLHLSNDAKVPLKRRVNFPGQVCVRVCESVPHCMCVYVGVCVPPLCVWECVCVCFSHATRLRILANSFPEWQGAMSCSGWRVWEVKSLSRQYRSSSCYGGAGGAYWTYALLRCEETEKLKWWGNWIYKDGQINDDMLVSLCMVSRLL